MKKILLIGGAGYIGSVLTEHLLSREYHVRCFDLLLYQNRVTVEPFLKNKHYEFVQGDLANPKELANALNGVEDVVLLAGLVGDPITRKYPDASRVINDEGLSRCVEVIYEDSVKKLIFISTCSNYGLMPEGVLADENSPLKPLSLYAESKVRLEKKILSLKPKANFCPTILRFATAFGLSPRMRFDLTVSEFTRSLFKDGSLLVYDADTWRPYCHVRDFSRLIHAVLEADPAKTAFQVFNAGGEINNYTKKMIVDEVLKRMPACKEVVFQPHGQDRRNYKVSFGKIKKVLNFEPEFTVADGVEELLKELKRGAFADYEQRKNFYGNYEIQSSLS